MRMPCRLVLPLVLAMILMTSCSTTAHETGVSEDPGHLPHDADVAVLIVNTTSDQYPESVELWSRYLASKPRSFDIRSIKGGTDAERVLSDIGGLDGDAVLFIYHGHGGEGFMYLGEGERLGYREVLEALSSKGVPYAIVVDACMSGSAEEAFREAAEVSDVPSLLVASCQADELSWNTLPERPGVPVSYMLRSLLLFDLIPSRIEGTESIQHPMVLASDGEGRIEEVGLPEPAYARIPEEYRFLL